MSQKTKIRIITVVTIIALLVVVYATFAQPLAVNTITKSTNNASWDIAFTKAVSNGVYGNAKEISPVTYSHTDASFNVLLTGPDDQITYEFTITNLGNLDAKVNDINIIPENGEDDAVLYSISGLYIGDELDAGESTKMSVTVSYNNKIKATKHYQKNARVVINYVEN